MPFGLEDREYYGELLFAPPMKTLHDNLGSRCLSGIQTIIATIYIPWQSILLLVSFTYH